ncbi:hypothetical protein FNF27_00679 [Cafeteria roenbergensis]|uniref:Uncharacterized protein n=1 Tax=Cafeteria roenbergensis TaxID=33653 RepID=A0A5A8D0T7_CAFRO|nr:hypothetical protein FNF29_00013 [Cafeteria roenbergensis]KAA0158364.1 hypothetical protein FNF31_05434 [Cafeteria roenbergensis]KAA0166177.1 hypothetical protein FNF28_03225 [Cafeteria roenbergensis]KAA0178131.1 hypothetical protein FNF27_00679 [Cafeteria roenbergensis]|eukprot:KAA0157437.1 hypothetical protein FNF29_00013 [Cafeteria roenbergensis]
MPAGGKITIGEKAYLCITINGKSRALFDPVADKYSAFRLASSRSSLPAGTPLIAQGTGASVDPNSTLPDGEYFMLFDVAVGSIRALPQKMYQRITVSGGSAVATTTIPVFTVVVAVEQGVPQSVVYDDGCYFCDEAGASCVGNVFVNSTSTVPNTAGSAFRSCASPTQCTSTSGGDCDLKIFVTWTGTDANGAYFESANMRFSRFRQFGVGQYYDDVVSGVNAGVNQVIKTGTEVINGL